MSPPAPHTSRRSGGNTSCAVSRPGAMCSVAIGATGSVQATGKVVGGGPAPAMTGWGWFGRLAGPLTPPAEAGQHLMRREPAGCDVFGRPPCDGFGPSHGAGRGWRAFARHDGVGVVRAFGRKDPLHREPAGCDVFGGHRCDGFGPSHGESRGWRAFARHDGVGVVRAFGRPPHTSRRSWGNSSCTVSRLVAMCSVAIGATGSVQAAGKVVGGGPLPAMTGWGWFGRLAGPLTPPAEAGQHLMRREPAGCDVFGGHRCDGFGPSHGAGRGRRAFARHDGGCGAILPSHLPPERGQHPMRRRGLRFTGLRWSGQARP